MKKSANGQERSFGVSVGCAFLILGLLFRWRSHATSSGFLIAIGAGLLLLAFAHPSLLRIPAAAWRKLSKALGTMNSFIILSFLFWFLITPMGIILRKTGWDPLGLRRMRGRSGWSPYPDRSFNAKHYEQSY